MGVGVTRIRALKRYAGVLMGGVELAKLGL